MKLKILFTFLLFGGLGSYILFFKPFSFYSKPVLADIEAEIGLHFPDSGKYLVSKNFLRKGPNNSFRSIEAVSGKKLLKLAITSGLSPEEAQQTVVERANMIQSLFSNLPSPYPGAITNRVEIPDELQPQVKLIMADEGQRTLYILSSNARYTYGAMSREMASFRGGLAFIYDKAIKTLFRIDLYLPKDEFNEQQLIEFFKNITLVGSQGKTPDEMPAVALDAVTARENHETTSPDNTHALRNPAYNLIIIAFEPLGADHVSSYGYEKKTTPNLDAFAKESFLFENASSPSSWSLPVFMSWFTSLYPSQHKVINKYSKFTDTEQVLANLAELSPDAVTLTHVMKENGYRAAAFTSGASLAGSFGFSKDFDHYFDKKDFGGFDLTMPLAVEWLDKNLGQNFFLFVQGYDVHGKFPLDRSYLDRFLDKPYSGSSGATEGEYWALRNKSLEEGGLSLSEEDTNLWKAVYNAKIFAADKRFGEFVDTLRQMDLLDNSIIIVSSGSGNEYLQHGGIDHGFSLYEELLHVPLLIRIPGTGGKRVKELVSTIDLMPTVIDLLGIKAAENVTEQMRGVSLLPLMADETLGLDAVAETDYLNRVFKRSIRTHDGWKFIVSLDSEKRELYNLNDDPGEKRNIVSKNPRRAYELELKMFKILKGR